jgi:hypothetical protein
MAGPKIVVLDEDSDILAIEEIEEIEEEEEEE